MTALKQSVRERLHLEAAYLQAQIQPHFLFNTLNSIAALSEIDTNRMSMLLSEFGNYLSASFDFKNLAGLIPLEHELNLVRSYVFIEQERFEERLNVVWDIDPQLSFQLPPLTIQPLVENAVRHGVLARQRGGTVTIQISRQEGQTAVSIMDDGVGMSEEVMKKLLRGQSLNRPGVGLLNTDRRLKRFYGQGIHIQSKQDEGTTVTFYVPL